MRKQNKFSAKKKLASAVAMLMVSTVMLSSATYAWFTMNKTVSVTGMKLQATADDGLVISDFTKDNWATSWDVNMSAGAVLAPTSTYAVATPTWVRNASDFFDDAEADQADGYEDLTLSWSTEAATSGSIGSVTESSVTTNYVLKRTFYIKAVGQDDWSENLVIDEVTASGNTNSADLDKALRVLVVVTSGDDTDAFVYAPFTGATTSYNYKGTATGAQAVTAIASTTDSTCTNITSIPIDDDDAIKVEMYMYFEGEDDECKSSNISGITVDTLTVSAKFKTTAGPADATTTP